MRAAMVLVALLAGALLPVAAGEDGLSIAPFRGDKKGAVSLTFDDGTPDHIETAIPLLNEFGYHGTFFVITSGIPDQRTTTTDKNGKTKVRVGWDEWKKAAAQGHEIGNHSATHPGLDGIKDEKQLEREIVESAKVIAAKAGVAPVSFAYPFCKRNEQVNAVVFRDHLLARGYKPCYGSADFNADGAQKYIDEAIEKHTWHVALIHGVGNAPEYRKHIAYIKQHDADLWMDTYGNVGRYVEERKQGVFDVLEKTASSVRFRICLPVEMMEKDYDVPLTVIVATGLEKAQVTATAAGSAAPLPVLVQPQRALVDMPPKVNVTVSWKP